MRTSAYERERPSEWLRDLRERQAGYVELLRDSGEPALAAYRVASARCRASERPTEIPTAREIRAAACEVLCAGMGERTPVPSTALLVEECESAGLLVLRP